MAGKITTKQNLNNSIKILSSLKSNEKFIWNVGKNFKGKVAKLNTLQCHFLAFYNEQREIIHKRLNEQ